MKPAHSLHHDISQILWADRPDLLAIYLFGSTVQGSQTPESDIDIAILLSDKLDALQRWELTQKLATHLGQDVDLVDLRTASTVMQFQIIHTGQRIFTADETICSQFEDRVFSMYVDLNENRAGILADIQESGTVFSHG